MFVNPEGTFTVVLEQLWYTEQNRKRNIQIHLNFSVNNHKQFNHFKQWPNAEMFLKENNEKKSKGCNNQIS